MSISKFKVTCMRDVLYVDTRVKHLLRFIAETSVDKAKFHSFCILFHSGIMIRIRAYEKKRFNIVILTDNMNVTINLFTIKSSLRRKLTRGS